MRNFNRHRQAGYIDEDDWGCLIVGGIILAFCGGLGFLIYNGVESDRAKAKAVASTRVLTDQVSYIATGPDGVMDTKEKRALLDEFGFEKAPIDEREVLKLNPLEDKVQF